MGLRRQRRRASTPDEAGSSPTEFAFDDGDVDAVADPETAADAESAADPDGRAEATLPVAPEAAPSETGPPRALSQHPLVRLGVYAWALVGLTLVLVGLAAVSTALRVLVAPLVLALFPAALLAPIAGWLMRRRVPPAAASLLVLLAGLGVLVGAIGLLTPAIAAELPGLADSVRQGLSELQAFLEAGPFGIDPARVERMMESLRTQGAQVAQQAAGTVAAAVAEGIAGLIFGLVALFFYLKDGPRIAAWVRDLFPERTRADVQAIGTQTWTTVGAYFRGQLLVALIDAVFIGLGLFVLGIPLALPLAVLVFLGGLFPIVGAVVSGAIAVLVALADAGLGTALLVLAIVVAVQQLESNVFAPVVLGRATALHPLAVILAIAAGGVLLGVLGAFLAVPVAASVNRACGYLGARHRAARQVLSPAESAASEDR